MKPLPWSFSSLNKFVTCPMQYYETKVLKHFQDEPGEVAKWGTYVHKCIEDFVNDGVPMPENTLVYVPQVEQALHVDRPQVGFGAKIQAELELALSARFEPCEWKAGWVRGIIDLLIVDGDTAWAKDWKGLAVDTPVPTPKGFTLMRDLRVGDALYAKDGSRCKVTAKSPVFERPCFEISFDDKTSVVCDNIHEWVLATGEVVATTELVKGDTIDVCEPLKIRSSYMTRPKQLLIDPYVMGMWLADGKHTSSEICKPDEFIWDEIERRGYVLGKRQKHGASGTRGHSVLGIRKHLQSLGVMGNKHIPRAYLRAGYSYRLDLLRGLMDGDGNANPTRKQAVFTSCNKRLSDDVKHLLLTLGQRVNQSTTTQRGFGLTVTAYPLAFRPQGINPFLLPRKANRIDPLWGAGRSSVRKIVSVRSVPTVPTQCITVDSKDSTFLCTENFIPTHNCGKVKPDSKQLKLFALMVFYHYPEVQTVHTSFEWLQFKQRTQETYTRDQIPALWAVFEKDLQQYVQAFKTDVWQCRPSGLCRGGWCPVESCQHWRPKK